MTCYIAPPTLLHWLQSYCSPLSTHRKQRRNTLNTPHCSKGRPDTQGNKTETTRESGFQVMVCQSWCSEPIPTIILYNVYLNI